MPGQFEVTWYGVEEARRAIRHAQAATPEKLGMALYEEANEIMAESKTIAPHKDGGLEASGEVGMPVYSGGQMEVTLGYGGPSIAYAVVQHERLDYHHADGRRAKFLEAPFVAAMPRLMGRLRIRLARIFARSV